MNAMRPNKTIFFAKGHLFQKKKGYFCKIIRKKDYQLHRFV